MIDLLNEFKKISIMTNFEIFALFITYLSGGLFIAYHDPERIDIPAFGFQTVKLLALINLVLLPYILLYQNYKWWIAIIIHIISILLSLNIIVPGFIARFHDPRNYGIITLVLNLIALIIMVTIIF